jgi:hypothetical protein
MCVRSWCTNEHHQLLGWYVVNTTLTGRVLARVQVPHRLVLIYIRTESALELAQHRYPTLTLPNVCIVRASTTHIVNFSTVASLHAGQTTNHLNL